MIHRAACRKKSKGPNYGVESYTYSFSRVFSESTSQAAYFEETAGPMVGAGTTLDGWHHDAMVCSVSSIRATAIHSAADSTELNLFARFT